MSDIRQLRKALVTRLLEGAGVASPIQRRAAFDNAGLSEPTSALVDKIVHHASRISDEDVVAMRASGSGEDAIFEIVVCAATGEAARQYDAALAALDAAMDKR